MEIKVDERAAGEEASAKAVKPITHDRSPMTSFETPKQEQHNPLREVSPRPARAVCHVELIIWRLASV